MSNRIQLRELASYSYCASSLRQQTNPSRKKRFHRVENVIKQLVHTSACVHRDMKHLGSLQSTNLFECSPNFPRALYLDERTLTYEPIVNLYMRFRTTVRVLIIKVALNLMCTSFFNCAGVSVNVWFSGSEKNCSTEFLSKYQTTMGTTLTNQLLQKQTVTIPLKRSTEMHVLSIHLQVTKLQSYRATAFWFLLFPGKPSRWGKNWPG